MLSHIAVIVTCRGFSFHFVLNFLLTEFKFLLFYNLQVECQPV